MKGANQMRTTIPKLRRIIRKVITESDHYSDDEAAAGIDQGSLYDIIQVCVKELQDDPDADLDTVCERWASMYGIPWDELQDIKDEVYRRL